MLKTCFFAGHVHFHVQPYKSRSNVNMTIFQQSAPHGWENRWDKDSPEVSLVVSDSVRWAVRGWRLHDNHFHFPGHVSSGRSQQALPAAADGQIHVGQDDFAAGQREKIQEGGCRHSVWQLGENMTQHFRLYHLIHKLEVNVLLGSGLKPTMFSLKSF